MTRKPLPLLAIGTAYEAADFERFEYSRVGKSDTEAILRLHLKNGTTIDLPTTHDELKHLLVILCESFPDVAVAHVKMRRWV
jgi:hypothetical protein